MLGSGSLLMKPSASPPNDAAPAAWVVARATPKPVAASGEALPGSIQRRIRQLLVDAEHLRHVHAALGAGLGEPAQSVGLGREEAGRRVGVGLHDRGGAVGETQLGRRRRVAACQRCGGHDRRAEEVLGVLGDDGLAGHVAGSDC